MTNPMDARATRPRLDRSLAVAPGPARLDPRRRHRGAPRGRRPGASRRRRRTSARAPRPPRAKLGARIAQYGDALYGVRGLFAASDEVTHREFRESMDAAARRAALPGRARDLLRAADRGGRHRRRRSARCAGTPSAAGSPTRGSSCRPRAAVGRSRRSPTSSRSRATSGPRPGPPLRVRARRGGRADAAHGDAGGERADHAGPGDRGAARLPDGAHRPGPGREATSASRSPRSDRRAGRPGVPARARAAPDIDLYDAGPAGARRARAGGATAPTRDDGAATARAGGRAVRAGGDRLRRDGAPLDPQLRADPRAAPENQVLLNWLPIVAGIVLALVAFWVISLSHRTERRAVELAERMTEKLRHSQTDLARSNAELERFAYVASHDLREPLRTITGFLGLLSRRYRDRLDDDGREFIDLAVGGAKRMDALIAELLEYSRVGRGETTPEPTDLDAAWSVAVAQPLGGDRRRRRDRHQRPAAGGHGRSRRDGAGPPEPARQRDQVPRRAHAGDPRLRGPARRALGDHGRGRRARHRPAPPRPDLRPAPAPAPPRRGRGHGHGPRDLQEDRRVATAAGSGSSRARATARASPSRCRPPTTRRRGRGRKYRQGRPRRRRRDLHPRRRTAGAAGLAYVVLAGVEGMDALLAPAAGADADAIRAAYADRALAVVTALAGVASLACYVASRGARGAPRRAGARRGGRARGAGRRARRADRRGRAAVARDGRGDGAVRGAFAAQHDLRLLAGPCMALALACLATAPALPRPLARAARPVAAALAVAPFAPDGAALVAFGLHARVDRRGEPVAARRAGARAARARPPRRVPRARVAAGGVGLGLLALPAAAGSLLRLGPRARRPSRPSPAASTWVPRSPTASPLRLPAAPRGRSRPRRRCSRRASSPSRSPTSSRSTSAASRRGRGSCSSPASAR